jgi:uncharacterized protein (DUF1015 family)
VAEIRPFRGVRFDQRLVDNLATVICPIYDITTPEMQQELYHRSEYNFVRLEHGRELPQDTSLDNKYTRAAATLKQWLKQGVLKVDQAPAIYLHDQYFTYQAREYRRRGIVVRVRLEEWDKLVVRPHEGTLTEAKGDRLSLLWACQANTSPILSLFEDRGRRIASLLAREERREPIINFTSAEGERHKVWAITEPEAISQICNSLANQPLYIADGHHRYESALTHQRERIACSASLSGDEAFNFVMMTLVDFADPGLLILPPHRLVRGISKPTLDEFRAELGTLFDVKKLPLSRPGVWRQVDDIFAGVKLGDAGKVRLILFGLAAKHLFVLKLRDPAAASQMMPYFHSELYKSLDVSLIDHILLEELLGLGSGREEVRIVYSYDKQDAVNRVLDQEYQLAFLLSPIRPEVIKAVADAGDRMPRKSTYFYPKLPVGLVFHRLE